MQGHLFPRIGLLLRTLFLGMLLSTSLSGWSQNAEISGQVQRNGVPLDFLVIKLTDGAGHLLNATLTDENGAFEFPHLEAGLYRLAGEYHGFPIQARVTIAVDAHVILSLSPSQFRYVPESSHPAKPDPILLTQTSHPSCTPPLERRPQRHS